MKAVVFDLFETLVTEWGRYKYTKQDMATDLGLDREDFAREWKKLRNDMNLGVFRDMESVIKHLAAALNAKPIDRLVSEVCRKLDENKSEIYQNANHGVLAMVKTLKARGYKTGLISNCDPGDVCGFKDSAIYPYFDAVVLSYEAGLVKPDKKIYEHCAHLLGVACADCLFVGDGGSSELDGATKAGMSAAKAVWFSKSVIESFDEDKTYPLMYTPGELLEYIETM